MTTTELEQRDVCRRWGAEFLPCDPGAKIGVARNVGSGAIPLNGLRHPVVMDTAGWYIWAGEVLSSDPSFFEPLHVAHLSDLCPEVLPFLGLAPGWRFLIAPEHEDVWYDSKLLKV